MPEDREGKNVSFHYCFLFVCLFWSGVSCNPWWLWQDYVVKNVLKHRIFLTPKCLVYLALWMKTRVSHMLVNTTLTEQIPHWPSYMLHPTFDFWTMVPYSSDWSQTHYLARGHWCSYLQQSRPVPPHFLFKFFFLSFFGLGFIYLFRDRVNSPDFPGARLLYRIG